MPILYDRQGNPVDVPDDQVAAAVASGKLAFPKGQDVIMKGEGGELYDVPPEEAAEMYRRGYRHEFTQEREERKLQEEYGGAGGQAITAAHAAGNVLTFGLLDVAGKEIGGEKYVQEVKKFDKANPGTKTAAELATVFGSFLPSGGAGAISKLTRLPRDVAKLGRTVERAALKGLGGAKGGMVRQALVKGTAVGAGAGAEGALYGAGQFLSEQALGETEATAENLVAHMGMGAMWGGAGGAAFGGGGEVLRRGLGKGIEFAKRSSKGVVRMWEKATGNKAVPGLVDAIEEQIAHPKVGAYSKAAGGFIREEPENIARFLQGGKAGKEARRIGSKTAKERDEIISSLSDKLDNVEELYEGAAEQMMGRMKMKNMGSIKTVKNELTAAQEATALIDDSVAKIDDMLASGDYVGAAGGRLKKAKKSIERHQKELNKSLARGGDDVGAELHGTIDSLKRDLQKLRKKTRPEGQTLDVMDVAKTLEDIQEGFRLHLEKPEFYGAVANAQKSHNAIWSRILGRNKLGRKLREVVGEKEWRSVYATNRGAMEHFINDMGRARNKNLEEFFLSQIDDKIAFARNVRETFDELPASLTSKLDKAEDLAMTLRKEYETAYKTVALQNQLGDIVQKSSLMQSVVPAGLGAGVGYMLGGEEGLALGLGLSVFTNPGRMIQLRAALDRMASSTELGIVKSIKGYVNKAIGKVKPTARGMVAPASLKILQESNWGDKRTKDKNRHEAFERRTKELTEFLSNPQKAIDRIDRNTAVVSEVAPNVATAMKIKAVQSARYLYDKAPKPLDRGTLLTNKWKPSDLELARFERIAAVVDNPENALKSLKAGCLTVEEVDALRDNYPRIYEQIVTTLAEQIPELRNKLPYRERVQLSILFGVPVDSTMEPEFLAMMQAVGGAAAMPMPTANQPKASGSYSKLSVDNANMTSTQRVEMNKLT